MKYKEILRRYSEGPNHLSTYLKNVPEEAIDYKPAPGKWSIRNIYAHLMDCEVNSFVRIRKAIAEPKGTIMPFDQDAWAKHFNYDELDPKLAVNLIKELRQIQMTTLNSIFDETWLHHMHHPQEGELSIYDWIKKDIDHADIHIKQMNRNVYDWTSEQRAKRGIEHME